jgi:hypothetical protein
MVLKLSAPGVQDAGEASTATSLRLNDIFEGFRALLHEDTVELFRIPFTEATQLRWDGEGDHEVGHGE